MPRSASSLRSRGESLSPEQHRGRSAHLSAADEYLLAVPGPRYRKSRLFAIARSSVHAGIPARGWIALLPARSVKCRAQDLSKTRVSEAYSRCYTQRRTARLRPRKHDPPMRAADEESCPDLNPAFRLPYERVDSRSDRRRCSVRTQLFAQACTSQSVQRRPDELGSHPPSPQPSLMCPLRFQIAVAVSLAR